MTYEEHEIPEVVAGYKMQQRVVVAREKMDVLNEKYFSDASYELGIGSGFEIGCSYMLMLMSENFCFDIEIGDENTIEMIVDKTGRILKQGGKKALVEVVRSGLPEIAASNFNLMIGE